MPTERDVASTEFAVGYTTVSRDGAAQQSDLRAQAEAVKRACDTHRLSLLELVREPEVQSGPDLARPRLLYALKRIASGDARCLVVPALDRLSRSTASLGTVMAWLDRHGARLVVADLDLDTGTSEGRLAANVLTKLAGFERQRVGERASAVPSSDRPARRSSSRPAVRDQPALARRILAMRGKGMTLQAIADTLNSEGVPTLRGGTKWRPSSVQSAAGYKRPARRKPIAFAEGREGEAEPLEGPRHDPDRRGAE
jgi:DNA invertase Pin-like site-specific DNA recombinase